MTVVENPSEKKRRTEMGLNDKEQQNDDGKPELNDIELKPNLKGDKLNLALLVLLCTLQGIPVGISMAVRTYVQNTKISYIEQAKFSLVDLPYSFKLLWAPLVDAAYFWRMGKRKTWLIPAQLFIGLALIFIGSNLNDWLNEDMTTLTCVFFCVNALAATQDIAVDGWSLTLLRRENLGYASTCNTSGQVLGMAIGYVFFILLESEKFCNKWLRFTDQDGGIVSMKGYLYFWGIIYVLVTTFIAIFKQENHDHYDKVDRINITQTYKLLWKIINLQTMKKFSIVMLTYEIVFSSMGSSVSNPKFMEYGVEKEDIALVDMSLIPMRIFIPVALSAYTTGPKPLKIFYKTVPYRLMLGITYAMLIYYTPYFVSGDSNNGSILFFMIYEFHRISRMALTSVIYLGVQSFFTRISDPRIGGTYMSLLNTVWYVGMATARVVSLGGLNMLTVKRCSTDERNTCRSEAEIKDCMKNDVGDCTIIVDGYFVEVAICTLSGIIWYLILSKTLRNLQSKRMSEWQVDDSRPTTANEATGQPNSVDGSFQKT